MTAYELAEKAEGLAYEIPADWSSGEPKNVATDIANMLRQQADRIAELEKDLHMVQRHYDQLNTQTKPLTDEEINEISMRCYVYPADGSMIFNQHKFARAIEERHGIK